MLLFAFACAPAPETDSGTHDTAADTAADTASPEDTATAQLMNWADGEPARNWFHAVVPLDAHSMYIADLALPEAAFDAGVDVAYDRPLAAGEVAVWLDDAVTDTAEIFACSDVEYTIVGRRVEVLSGRLVLDAVATGPDPVCGSSQTYAVTWTLTELATTDGPIRGHRAERGESGVLRGVLRVASPSSCRSGARHVHVRCPLIRGGEREEEHAHRGGQGALRRSGRRARGR